MYNLIMFGDAESWNEPGSSHLDLSRFLEHTVPALRDKFLPLSDESILTFVGLPTLFAYEFHRSPKTRAEAPEAFARLGNLTEVKRRQRELEFSFEFVANCPPIPMEMIAELAEELDISIKKGENYRSHWAIKDIDLLDVLRQHGLLIEDQTVAPDVADQLRALDASPPNPSTGKPKVFIVHGQDDGLKNEVGRWLARIGLDDIVLHEQPNLGRTIISKFREVSEGVAFALILMTPDDVGGIAGGKTAFRARQNVIFELGYFLGQLGPERVAALVVGDVETPSDYDGVIYIPYDKPGGWKLQLAREFVNLQIPIDPLRAF